MKLNTRLKYLKPIYLTHCLYYINKLNYKNEFK